MSTQAALDAAFESAFEPWNNAIRKEFKNVDERFDRMDARFHKFEERLEKVDERFDKVDERFDKVDERFDKVDERFDKIDGRLGQFYDLLMAQSTNPRAALSRDRVLPVSIMSRSPTSQLILPSEQFFPNTVIKFWSLQFDHRILRLAYLCNFYGIASEEILGDETEATLQDSSDSDQDGDVGPTSGSEQVLTSLRSAVAQQPLKALSCLASHLFLNFETISYHMGTIRDIRESKGGRRAGVKREAVSEESSKTDRDQEPHKRLATEHTIRDRQQGLRASDVGPRGLTLPLMIAGRPYADPSDDEPREPSLPSAKSIVGWASNSNSSGDRKYIRDVPDAVALRDHTPESKRGKPKEAKSSSQQSKGSTVPFTHTPTVIREAVGKREGKA